MTSPHVTAPPERFNFARHLIALNAARPDKTALIDDQGSLTYGQLADQVQRFAGALSALGLRREECVLLLMHDSCDWVVAFLGALHAGLIADGWAEDFPDQIETYRGVSDDDAEGKDGEAD